MSTVENDIYVEQMTEKGQEAIKNGDEAAVMKIVEELHLNGFEFASVMLKGEWDNKQELV